MLELKFVVFFKQKTAYEMRISDWSSDVCSSDLTVLDGGNLRLRWSSDGATVTGTKDSTDQVSPDAGGRLAVRATLDVNDGAGNNVVTFYPAPALDGPWEQLGTPVTTAGQPSNFTSTSNLQAGEPPNFVQ